MKITVNVAAFPGRGKWDHAIFDIHKSTGLKQELEFKKAIAYPALVNSHDHLIGNWYPKAGKNSPYLNSHIWVEDMKHAESVLERNFIWFNDGSFDLLKGDAPILAQIGTYKNILSGCTIVQDHGPNQMKAYYDLFPINVLRNYRQCHSLTLGNWWGGLTPYEEWVSTESKIPFIIHLGEGMDAVTRHEFTKLADMGLLQANTLIVHGVSLTKDEIKLCADAGTSICWCPSSNYFILGQTLDIEACMELGVNVVVGTDSSLSGSINMFDELRLIHEKFPNIPMKSVLEMVTVNAAKALLLPDTDNSSLDDSESLLIVDSLDDDPYLNLTKLDTMKIQLLLHQGKPIYGDKERLCSFDVDDSLYSYFTVAERSKFIIGNPMQLNNRVDAKLGYHKNFPFFPF